MRGQILHDKPLAPLTWLRVGGPAQYLFLPADTDDLIEMLKEHHPADAPVLPLGAASNVLIRDGGVSGLVVRLIGTRWAEVQMLDAVTLRVGAGMLDRHLARFAASKAIAGFEFLATIPGTIGGAVAMNAGCYGQETKDILIEVSLVTRSGQMVVLSASDIDLRYRRSALPEGCIVTSVIMRGKSGNEKSITELMESLKARRQATQPVKEMTGGSTFANPDPPGTPNQTKAWRLLDTAGARKMRCGGARFSDKHCNFLINDGTATAADLENLAQQAQRRVFGISGIALDWEIRRYGQA